jgi:hypothetical protein
MRDYKGWTAKERLASFAKTKAAIAAGIIPPPTQCNRCGKTTGRIDYHNRDYSDPIKYLEQICQVCHTRLHRMENKEIDANNVSSEVNEIVPKVPVIRENRSKYLSSELRENMHQIRIDFTKAIGLDWSENPNPSSGYKFEHNFDTRQLFLDKALRLREHYADLVNKTGQGKEVLEKMERNLINRDRKATWKL